MNRLALLSCVLGTGCFYIDPINQRPSIDIRQSDAGEVYRDSSVTLEMVDNDPEGHIVFGQWRVYACTDATEIASCDTEPFQTEILDRFTFRVPKVRVDVAVPVESLRVVLEARDDHGAIARPQQELIIPVSDHPPVLELNKRTNYEGFEGFGYVIDTPVDLYAKVSDPDDVIADVTLAWQVFSPATNPDFDLIDIDVSDPTPMVSLQYGKRFTPKAIGMWEVQVTATDPLGVETVQTLMLDVVPDHAPCLVQWAPLAPPVGASYPLTESTLFHIDVVADDLDPYPTVPGDAFLGTTAFRWEIKQPGSASWTALAVTSNGVAIDPANYELGDELDIRVEIEDRQTIDPNCPVEDPTCSVISDDGCIQRQTWHLEVR